MSRARPRVTPRRDQSEIGPKERFEYAWKHFSFIADQRLKAFNFYVVLLAAATGATLTAWTRDDWRIKFVCLFWHLCTACAFFVVDWRNRKLLQIPKRALIAFEMGWKGAKLLAVDQRQHSGADQILSFTGVFWAALFGQAFIAVTLAYFI